MTKIPEKLEDMSPTEMNDTLCGRLFAWETPEDIPNRGAFQYWYNIEQRMISQQLTEEGWDSSSFEYQMEILKRYKANHKDDLSFRQICDLNNWKWEGQNYLRHMAEGEPKSVVFTREERERIMEHFAGANDLVSQSIYDKVKAMDLNNG